MYTIDAMVHLAKKAPDKFKALIEKAVKEEDYEVLLIAENAISFIKCELILEKLRNRGGA